MATDTTVSPWHNYRGPCTWTKEAYIRSEETIVRLFTPYIESKYWIRHAVIFHSNTDPCAVVNVGVHERGYDDWFHDLVEFPPGKPYLVLKCVNLELGGYPIIRIRTAKHQGIIMMTVYALRAHGPLSYDLHGRNKHTEGYGKSYTEAYPT